MNRTTCKRLRIGSEGIPALATRDAAAPPRSQTSAPLRKFAILLCLLPLGALAQEPPTPKAPYVAPLPEEGRWLVTLKYPEVTPESETPATKAATRFRPLTVETTKTGEARRVNVRLADGSTQTYHHVSGYLLSNTGEGVQLRTLSAEPPPYPGFAEGFHFIPPLKADMYTGLERLEGRDCFHYSADGTEVWVDVETMRPLAAKTADSLAVFSFLPTPPAPVTLPPEEAKLLKKQEKALHAFRAMR